MNFPSNICLFDGRNPADPDSIYKLRMHGDVRFINLVSVRFPIWNTKVIEMPRCESCASRHKQSYDKAIKVISGTSSFYVTFCFIVFHFFSKGFAAIALSIGGVVAPIIFLITISVIREFQQDEAFDAAKKENFGRVMELHDKGWRPGRKPWWA